jgi:hypothetical protein
MEPTISETFDTALRIESILADYMDGKIASTELVRDQVDKVLTGFFKEVDK